MIMNKGTKYKKQYEKDQQTIKYFHKIYRNFFQDKSECEYQFEFFTRYVDETKDKSFL